MYQRNRTINLDGRQGKQLAGDEWFEDHLVAPVKRYLNAVTKGEEKISSEFVSFLHRKFPNEMSRVDLQKMTI